MTKLNHLGNDLNRLISTMSLFTRKTMNRWIDEISKDLNVTPERLMVMYELRIQPNINLKELADSLMVSPASMSVMVQSLVEMDLIVRVTNPKDRRRVVLSLTHEGEKLFQQFDTEINSRFEEFAKQLSVSNQEDLHVSVISIQNVLDKIIKSL
jgi:DNA-binding MarR family transcriptional regulator